MEFKFVPMPSVEMPIDGLIELYQMLIAAKRECDWDRVVCAAECIADEIAPFEIPAEMNFRPTENSLIAMECKRGVLAKADGSDFQCPEGQNISEAEYCNQVIGGRGTYCKYRKCGSCDPRNGRLILEGNIPYCFDSSDQDDFLKAISKL